MSGIFTSSSTSSRYWTAAPNSLAIWALRASGKERSAIGSPGSGYGADASEEREFGPPKRAFGRPKRLFGPPKTGGARRRVHRARRHAVRDRRVVEARWRAVVRRIGMEERGQVLDLTAADLELALTAAVDRDPVVRAVLVDGEQLLQRAEPRWLRVNGLPRVRLHIVQRVQIRVPGDAFVVRREDLAGRVVQIRILEIGLRECLGNPPIELRIGLDVHRRPPVEPLEVQHLHRRELPDLRNQLRRPVVLRVELELERRVFRQPLLNGLGVRGLGVRPEPAQPRGADEGERLWITADDVMERRARLAEGEIKRGRLIRPTPVVARRLALRRRGEEVQPAHELAELAQRLHAGEVVDGAGVAVRDVIEHLVDDVLPDPLLALPAKVNHGRSAGELPELPIVLGELVRLDCQGQGGNGVEKAHGQAM